MGPWAAIIGAALGAVKANEEAKAFDQQRDQAIAQTRWSPWTGQGFGQLGRAPNPMDPMMQGLTAGLMMQGANPGAGAPQQSNPYAGPDQRNNKYGNIA